jgi:CDP-glucose 4,6-dehydratase
VGEVETKSDWSGRCALVTGIGGFVGSQLAAELLERGASVVGVLRDSSGLRQLEAVGIAGRIEIVRGSITDPGLVLRALNEYEVDTVFHLAAQALVGVANRSPMSTFESNIAGTWHVLDGTRLAPMVQRVVVASSDKAYGSQPVLPYTESSTLAGIYPYDASKVCTDVLARCYATSFALPVAVLRCANIYGPGDLNWSRLIPGTIRAALTGQNPIIRSDGTPERDYLYIADAVEGYLKAAEQLPEQSGAAFNIGTGRGVSVNVLVEEILAAVGTAGLKPRILGEARGEIDRQFLASDKANRVLGWSPRVDLIRGLAFTVDWYGNYLATKPSLLLQEVR